MPVLEVTIDAIKQQCMTCGATHAVPLMQGQAKARKAPYILADGDAIEVKVDGQVLAQVVTFVAADFAQIGAATAGEVAARLDAVLVGARADVDAGAVRIVSASAAPDTTAIEVSGGSARAKLGFDGRRQGARLLGVTKGAQTAVDTIDLPHCPECGVKECLIRTWDRCPAAFAASHHAQHRRCVNALAQHLRALGCSDPVAKRWHDAERAPPPDLDLTFPPGPIALAPVNGGAQRDG